MGHNPVKKIKNNLNPCLHRLILERGPPSETWEGIRLAIELQACVQIVCSL